MKPEGGNSYVQMRCGNKRVLRLTDYSYQVICTICEKPQGKQFRSRQQASAEALLRCTDDCVTEGCTDDE